MEGQGSTTDRAIDFEVDRYPTLVEGLQLVVGQNITGDEQVRRADIRFDADGNAYYRVWLSEGDEHEVGYAPGASHR